jgi:chromosome segregation ATPase
LNAKNTQAPKEKNTHNENKHTPSYSSSIIMARKNNKQRNNNNNKSKQRSNLPTIQEEPSPSPQPPQQQSKEEEIKVSTKTVTEIDERLLELEKQLKLDYADKLQLKEQELKGEVIQLRIVIEAKDEELYESQLRIEQLEKEKKQLTSSLSKLQVDFTEQEKVIRTLKRSSTAISTQQGMNLQNEMDQQTIQTLEEQNQELQDQVNNMTEHISELTRKYYHHAFLAAKLAMHKNFEVPELVECACKEHVDEKDLNIWLVDKLRLNVRN